jgi:hypothetical protein
MGYWENTTYVKHGSVADVARALDTVFAKEGMVRVAAPSQRARLRVEPMQYDGALDNDLWGFAIFPGSSGWSVVKSAPLEVLSERPSSGERMRLADVCEALATSAFQINVYDSTGTVLAEVSKNGDVLMSGFNGQGDDPMKWNGIAVTEERVIPRFEIHALEHLLPDLVGDDFAFAAAREIGGANKDYCDNIVSVDTLICHEPFSAPGGIALYYRWSGASRQLHVPSDN